MDPKRRDGTYIYESIDKDAYRKEKLMFQKLERALGRLHHKSKNTVEYRLVQPLLGWESSGTKRGRVDFHVMRQNGFMDDLTLFIARCDFDGNGQQQLEDFVKCVKQAVQDYRIKIISDSFEIQSMF